MDVSYNKFFKMLIDRKMKKKAICEPGWYSYQYHGKNGEGREGTIIYTMKSMTGAMKQRCSVMR